MFILSHPMSQVRLSQRGHSIPPQNQLPPRQDGFHDPRPVNSQAEGRGFSPEPCSATCGSMGGRLSAVKLARRRCFNPDYMPGPPQNVGLDVPSLSPQLISPRLSDYSIP